MLRILNGQIVFSDMLNIALRISFVIL